MKTFIHHSFPELKRIDGDTNRFYLTPEGKRYPSVSTVAGFKNAQAIKKWRESVGEAEANKISSRASKRGTAIHSLCEQYLKTGSAEPNLFDQEMFNSLVPILNLIDNIEAIEQPLYSDPLRVAGTVDLIATLNGVPTVIDFKTSRKPKEKENTSSYFHQTCMYSHAFYQHTGILINQMAIIIGVDDHEPQMFIERTRDWVFPTIELRESFLRTKGY